MLFTKTLLENTLVLPPYNNAAASEPHLPKVACCIPVPSSCHVGKCALRVLMHYGMTSLQPGYHSPICCRKQWPSFKFPFRCNSGVITDIIFMIGRYALYIERNLVTKFSFQRRSIISIKQVSICCHGYKFIMANKNRYNF